MASKNDDPADITVFAKSATGQTTPARARLVCLDESLDASLKDLEIPLDGSEQTVGRSQKNTMCIRYSELSREHARLFLRGDTWVVEDLDSLNGVYVNDEQVKQADLKEDDVVVIGNIPFRYMVERPEPTPAPSQKPAAAPKEKASAKPAPQAPPSTPELPAKPKTPPLAAQGAKGTMYVGHADIVDSLARPEEAPERRVPPAPKPSEGKKQAESVSSPAARAVRPPAKKRPFRRFIFAAAAAVVFAVGGYFYLQHQRAQEVNAIVLDYQAEFDAFIDSYESENVRFSKENLETELAEVRRIAARVDLAAKQYPDNSSFRALQARLAFLEFERRLNDRLQSGSIESAQNLLVRTRDRVQAVLRGRADWQGTDRDRIESVVDLIELGSVVTKFKLFRQRFPDPSNPGVIKPSSLDMREMQQLKQTLAAKKQANQLALSVTYSYFQRIVSEVDEQDVRLVNRWKEALKKTDG